jgi:hypothetical protein
VVCERPSVRPIARAESPRAIPREISSRSASARQRSGRRRDRGRIPPILCRYLLTVRFGTPAAGRSQPHSPPPLAAPRSRPSQPPADSDPSASRHLLVRQRTADSLGWCGDSLRPPTKAGLDPPVAAHLLFATSATDGPEPGELPVRASLAARCREAADWVATRGVPAKRVSRQPIGLPGIWCSSSTSVGASRARGYQPRHRRRPRRAGVGGAQRINRRPCCPCCPCCRYFPGRCNSGCRRCT